MAWHCSNTPCKSASTRQRKDQGSDAVQVTPLNASDSEPAWTMICAPHCTNLGCRLVFLRWLLQQSMTTFSACQMRCAIAISAWLQQRGRPADAAPVCRGRCIQRPRSSTPDPDASTLRADRASNGAVCSTRGPALPLLPAGEACMQPGRIPPAATRRRAGQAAAVAAHHPRRRG